MISNRDPAQAFVDHEGKITPEWYSWFDEVTEILNGMGFRNGRFMVKMSANQTTPSGPHPPDKVNFNTLNLDAANQFNTATHQLVVKSPGLYLIFMQSTVSLGIFVNGTLYARGPALVPLRYGDIVEIFAFMGPGETVIPADRTLVFGMRIGV